MHLLPSELWLLLESLLMDVLVLLVSKCKQSQFFLCLFRPRWV